MRNCIFHGDFNDKIIELNNDKNWRTIIGKEHPDKRMKDVELVLRIIALSEEFKKYEPPMKEFLNKFMAKNQVAAKEWIEDISEKFRKTAAIIVAKIGKKPFRPRGPMNISMLDSCFSIVMQNIDNVPDNLKDRHYNLLTDGVFHSYGTLSKKAVDERFDKVYDVLIK
ncbi:hypothetical protein MCHI_003829 [Candidatus Magnetoovum chiemensis]|nr:hypothetical protein MCHI_003829 [Candidatus Magnetoovum chiemensis]